jgi:RimJ/RimL family protein N-acetyltransferase
MGPVGIGPEIRTERLLMRRWVGEDLEPCALMNTEPEVVEYLAGPSTRVESAAFIEEMEGSFAEHDFGLWALELPCEASFVGCAGLLQVREGMPFAPAVEIGWRLARPWWGRGLATEAAMGATSYAFAELGLGELVAYTAERNERSRRVMDRLGMRRDVWGDFRHPWLAPGDPLAPHVLYRLESSS